MNTFILLKKIKIMRKYFKKALLGVLILLGSSMFLNAQVQININGTNVKHIVSPMIQGQGMIYSFEEDAIYADGKIAQTMSEIGTSFLRWPGGTVTTHYHWDNLNGQGWSDNWNPGYDVSNDKNPSEYMDLDEYMVLIGQTGAEPMLGINMSSGMEWGRQQDGVDEAVAMIEYCQSKNFDVKYFYLDNETYHTGNLHNKDLNRLGDEWTAESYAEQINIYAAAIRNLIPDAKLIPNWDRSLRKDLDNSMRTIIENAGSNFDYLDIHWYWKWGVASWDEWKSKTPMEIETEYYNGGTLVEEMEYFNELAASLGQSHLKLASLEWNIGPGPWQTDPDHSKFKTALMQSEMQMQFIQGGLEVGCIWSMHWPDTEEAEDRFILDVNNDYARNPSADVFELYKNAKNGDLVESTTTDDEIMSATVIKDNKAYVYLLNKKEENKNVEFVIQGYDIVSVNQAVRFENPGVVNDIGLWIGTSGNYKAKASANTLMMVVFNVTQILSADYLDETAADIIVYPNPASKMVAIQTEGFEGAAHIILYNIMGIPVVNRKINSGESAYKLFVNELPKGTYLFTITDEAGNRSKRKIIIK